MQVIASLFHITKTSERHGTYASSNRITQLQQVLMHTLTKYVTKFSKAEVFSFYLEEL